MSFISPRCLNFCSSSSKHYIKPIRGDTSRTQKHNNLLKVSLSQHITSKNINQWQPRIVYKSFQNQEDEKVFTKAQDHKLDIKLDQPKRTIKHVMQAHGMEQSQMDWQNLISGKCDSLPLMCLKYRQVHSRLNPKMQSTIGLQRLSNSSPLKCNVQRCEKLDMATSARWRCSKSRSSPIKTRLTYWTMFPQDRLSKLTCEIEIKQIYYII